MTAIPVAPHGVNDPLGGQPVSPGDLGLTGRAAAQRATLLAQFGPGRPVNSSIYAAPAEQRAVGRVDDSIDALASDVVFEYRDACWPRPEYLREA